MKWFVNSLKWSAALTGVIVVATVTQLVMRNATAQHMRWFVVSGLTVIALLWCGLILLRQLHYWQQPMRKLSEMLEGARMGEIPIDELSNVGGGLKPAIPLIQELLRDLRMERMHVAALTEEMRQKVASRTDALERQLGSMRAAAMRDALTGLYNRRMLDSTFPGLVAQSTVDGNDLAVLMIDVDYFKQLNDTMGHAAGDAFLKALGQLIRSAIRASDFAFRCGGDEFVIIMPGASKNIAQQMSQRLISLTDQLAVTTHAARPPRLSIGVSCLSDLGTRRADELLSTADQALYDLKAARKSRRVA